MFASLGAKHAEYRPQILTGVSAGAINTLPILLRSGSWQESVEARGLWQAMHRESVPTGLGQLAGRMVHWGLHLVSGRRYTR